MSKPRSKVVAMWIGASRLVAAILLLCALGLSLAESLLTASMSFSTGAYAIAAIVLLSSGLFLALSQRETRVLDVLFLSATCWVVASVVIGLLEGGPTVNLGETVLAALAAAWMIVDWTILGPSRRPRLSTIWVTLSYPALWIWYAMIRASAIEVYPLPIVGPEVDGPLAMVLSTVAFGLALLALAGLFWVVRRHRPQFTSSDRLHDVRGMP
ncbi:hypothetical protein [Luethyella okanaganae]|uniref:Integral membrane protein n=1 Tax=Luethyella okanaganae TaxID=69372 RepID=A0ABW1VKE8_9MICO